MKRCPSCNRVYSDLSLNFCLEDGTPLVADTPNFDPNVTLPYPSSHETSEPPPTEIYRPDSPALNQVTAKPQVRAWSPTPLPQKRKSYTVWWILGGVAVLGIGGIGLTVILVVLASIGSQMEVNTNNSNSNIRAANRNVNNASVGNSNKSETNSNSSSLAAALNDDFSEQKWGTGSSRFGEIWYADDEYHMRSKHETYLVMYAPSTSYNTENATVKVKARSVDGSVPSAGFGLVVHGQRNKGLQDYALLIYPGGEAQYEVITHKEGNQSALVPRTQASIIRSGSNTNQLEVRIRGDELSFYINGQYLTSITDSANFKTGLAGFYTSDSTEVAFDDLEITRDSSAK